LQAQPNKLLHPTEKAGASFLSVKYTDILALRKDICAFSVGCSTALCGYEIMKEKLQEIYKNIKNCNTCSGTIKFKGKPRFGFPPSNDYIAMIIGAEPGPPASGAKIGDVHWIIGLQ